MSLPRSSVFLKTRCGSRKQLDSHVTDKRRPPSDSLFPHLFSTFLSSFSQLLFLLFQSLHLQLHVPLLLIPAHLPSIMALLFLLLPNVCLPSSPPPLLLLLPDPPTLPRPTPPLPATTCPSLLSPAGPALHRYLPPETDSEGSGQRGARPLPHHGGHREAGDDGGSGQLQGRAQHLDAAHPGCHAVHVSAHFSAPWIETNPGALELRTIHCSVPPPRTTFDISIS